MVSSSRIIVLLLFRTTSTAAMVKQRPLTPPSLDGRDLQYGFYQLMQHNAATQYQPDHYTLHENAHLQSGSNTTLSSPEPNQLPTSHYGTGQYHGGYQGQYDPGLSIQHVSKALVNTNIFVASLANIKSRTDMMDPYITRIITMSSMLYRDSKT